MVKDEEVFPANFSLSLSKRKRDLFFLDKSPWSKPGVSGVGQGGLTSAEILSVCMVPRGKFAVNEYQIHWYSAANAQFLFVTQFGTGVDVVILIMTSNVRWTASATSLPLESRGLREGLRNTNAES